MKANNTVIIGIVVVVIAIIFGLQMMFSSYMPRYSWYEQFWNKSEQPYGHKLFFELLSTDCAVVEINKPLKRFFNDSAENGTYMIVSHEMYLWNGNQDSLLAWVAKGNDAFFSCQSAPWFIDSLVGYDLDSVIYFESRDTVEVSLSSALDSQEKKYQYVHKQAYDTTYREWAYVSDSVFVYDIEDSVAIKSIGRLYFGHNFFEIQHGKGRLLVHLEPYLFTNYHILRDEGFEYASNVIGSLNNTGKIYWDNYSTDFHYEEEEEEPEYMSDSPLKIIFGNEAFKHAWWVLVVGVVLFVLLRGKREQRIIPIIYYPENTSKAYARALGALYHRSGEPKYLASEMMHMFHNYNRRKYQVEFDPNNKDFAAFLAKKSKVKIEVISDILNIGRRLEYSDLAKMAELVQLYELLNFYYKSSK